jgi:hypothetical protein
MCNRPRTHARTYAYVGLRSVLLPPHLLELSYLPVSFFCVSPSCSLSCWHDISPVLGSHLLLYILLSLIQGSPCPFATSKMTSNRSAMLLCALLVALLAAVSQRTGSAGLLRCTSKMHTPQPALFSECIVIGKCYAVSGLYSGVSVCTVSSCSTHGHVESPLQQVRFSAPSRVFLRAGSNPG